MFPGPGYLSSEDSLTMALLGKFAYTFNIHILIYIHSYIYTHIYIYLYSLYGSRMKLIKSAQWE